MPIRRSLDGVRHPRPQLVAIAWNGWSRSIGTGGRNQSEQLVAITRCAQPDLMRSIRLFGEKVMPALRDYQPF